MTLQPAYTVTDIKVMELDSEYIADMDSYIGDNAKLQITYSNGKSEELVFGRGETYVFDNYGNDFQYHVVQGSGEDEVTFSPWDTLSAGEYQIVFEHNEPNGRIYTSVPVAVKNINEFEFTNRLSWKAFVKDVHKGNRNIELYNLSSDPREQNNVAAEHPEIVEQVLDIFRTEHTDAEIVQFNLPVW